MGVGRENATNFTAWAGETRRVFLREVINAPSVSCRLWHCELRQPQDQTKCLIDRETCSMSLLVMTMTSLLRGTDVNLRDFSFGEFTKDGLLVVFRDRDIYTVQHVAVSG